MAHFPPRPEINTCGTFKVGPAANFPHRAAGYFSAGFVCSPHQTLLVDDVEFPTALCQDGIRKK